MAIEIASRSPDTYMCRKYFHQHRIKHIFAIALLVRCRVEVRGAAFRIKVWTSKRTARPALHESIPKPESIHNFQCFGSRNINIHLDNFANETFAFFCQFDVFRENVVAAALGLTNCISCCLSIFSLSLRAPLIDCNSRFLSFDSNVDFNDCTRFFGGRFSRIWKFSRNFHNFVAYCRCRMWKGIIDNMERAFYCGARAEYV